MRIKLAGITLFVLFFVIQLSAQPSERGRCEGKCFGMNQLNLTDAQETKLKDLKEKHFSEMGKLRDELDKLKIDKRGMLRDSNLNRSSFLELEKKISQLHEKISLSRADHQMDVYEMLTDDQKKEFRNSPMRGGDNHGERMHKKGNHKSLKEDKPE